MLIEVSPYQKSTGNKMTDKTAIQKYRVTRNIISESAQMQAIFRHVKRVAPTKATVLITVKPEWRKIVAHENQRVVV